VLERWDQIKKRVRTKKAGAQVAALLNGCEPFMLSKGCPLTLHIAASAPFHYRQVRIHLGLVKWAVKIEMGIEMYVMVHYPVKLDKRIAPPLLKQVSRYEHFAAVIQEAARLFPLRAI